MSSEAPKFSREEMDRHESGRILTSAELIRNGATIVNSALRLSDKQLETLYRENEAYQNGNPSAETESSAETPKVTSFKTERGSVYRYDSEGKSTRFKTATGKLKERTDLTVFADLTPEQEADFMDSVYAESATPDSKRTVQVLERQEDNNGKFIRDVSEINDPSKLLLAILQKGRIVGYVPASLSPKVGATVFERRNIKKDGQRFTERHIGHKVTEISYA